MPSEYQRDWIQIRSHVLSGLSWVQSVHKSYQQTALVGKELRVNMVVLIPENFRCHDEAGSCLVNLDIPCHQPYIFKCRLKVSVFLIGQSFDRRRIDCPTNERKLYTSQLMRFWYLLNY